jgi:hypothetical protein
MTIDEYAQAQAALGERIVKTGGVYWRRVRPCFFRPMLAYQAYETDEIVNPCDFLSRLLGGYQHVVPSNENANSTMNFLILDQLHEYGLENLRHEQRRYIKKVARQFEIRPLNDAGEFIDQGYPAYVSFYTRTGYSYKTERARKEKFGEWANTIANSKAIVWGGYGKEGLVAVSILYEVEHTLVYASYFCETGALCKGIGELMFHTIREHAARQSAIQEIFVREYHGGNGMDKYYLLRGCKVLRKPANLHISRGAHEALKMCAARRYAMLRGYC